MLEIIGNKIKLRYLKFKLHLINKYMAKHKDKPEEPAEKKLGAATRVSESELFKNFEKSNEVMKAVKAQFGYSGYSNPNYVNLAKQIEDNDKIIAGLK